MGVAAHLGIDLADYDARIRTFIPDYDVMIEAAAAAVPRGARTIVDLGTGTGTLAARCLSHAPRARIVGIDSDPDILAVAARRLPVRASFICGSFVRTPIPSPTDAVVASFALHHVRTRAAKARLYRRVHAALSERGVCVTVDCQPSLNRTAARAERHAWTSHLLRSYSRIEADALLKAWAAEDVYVPLESEIGLLERAGFDVQVVWRRGAFAVLRAGRLRSSSASARR